MKLSLWSIGKPHDALMKAAIDEFTKRTNRYFPLQWNIISTVKMGSQLPEKELRKREGELILQMLKEGDYLVALDEKGYTFTSESFASFLQQRASESVKNIVFLIGGVYGLDEAVIQNAKQTWSLSKLTFPHQLVRLILAEQVYRACTIIRNEKYHHR
jgi:23S rRNA (pseudouridine1915-N3)-methyltransferase